MSIDDYLAALMEQSEPMRLLLRTKALSKERPRTGKAGHMYTPKRTRDFENLVAAIFGTTAREPFTCAVAVDIEIVDPVPKSYKKMRREACLKGYLTPQVGDLDNKVKAITDALNGHAYVDDRQIAKLTAKRRYGDSHIINVEIRRIGLSAAEVELYEELGYDAAINNQSRPRLGKARGSSIPVREK